MRLFNEDLEAQNLISRNNLSVFNNIYAGNNIDSHGNVTAAKDINSGADINAERDIKAVRDIIVDKNLKVGNFLFLREKGYGDYQLAVAADTTSIPQPVGSYAIGKLEVGENDQVSLNLNDVVYSNDTQPKTHHGYTIFTDSNEGRNSTWRISGYITRTSVPNLESPNGVVYTGYFDTYLIRRLQ